MGWGNHAGSLAPPARPPLRARRRDTSRVNEHLANNGRSRLRPPRTAALSLTHSIAPDAPTTRSTPSSVTASPPSKACITSSQRWASPRASAIVRAASRDTRRVARRRRAAVSRRLSQKKGPAGASTSSSAYNAAAVSGVDRSARRSPAKTAAAGRARRGRSGSPSWAPRRRRGRLSRSPRA